MLTANSVLIKARQPAKCFTFIIPLNPHTTQKGSYHSHFCLSDKETKVQQDPMTNRKCLSQDLNPGSLIAELHPGPNIAGEGRGTIGEVGRGPGEHWVMDVNGGVSRRQVLFIIVNLSDNS